MIRGDRPAPGDARSVLLEVFGLDGIDRIRRRIDHTHQDRENRLFVEADNWAEQYLDGRLNFALYLHGRGRANGIAKRAVHDAYRTADKNIVVLVGEPFKPYPSDPNNDDNLIVLVDVAKFPSEPEGRVPLLARVHCIEDKTFELRESVVYRGLLSHIYKVAPLLMHREVDTLVRAGGLPNNLGREMVEAGSQAVDRVTDNQTEIRGKGIGLDSQGVGGQIFIRLYNGSCEVRLSDSIQERFELVDVAVGPLNL